MRQLYPRASRLRFFLVVAAVSVVTLAASSPIYSAARGGHLIGHTSKSPAAAAAGTAATADCSKAAGLEVVQRLHLNHPEVTDPVYKVLCGSFTGPGSQTMVVSLMGPGSSGMLDWVVFRWAGDAWQLLMKQHQAAMLTAAGSDIRETVSIFRAGDPRCCPSGGTKSRIWHWDGSRLVAGPWKQVTPGKVKGRDFYSPLPGAIACGLSDDPGNSGSALPSGVGAYCQSANPQNRPENAHKVTMASTGRLTICRNRGLTNRCNIGNPGEGTPTLRFGRQVTVGRFRCRSLRTGVKCTVIRSGKGFLFNSSGVRRVGP